MTDSFISTDTLPTVDLGHCAYREAWERQLAFHQRVLDGEFPRGLIILVEHPPVVTFGRRPGSADHLLADAITLSNRGVEVVQSDRGGDITFHGPGQLVVYPIIPLRRYNLGLLEYMRLLEQVVIDAVRPFGIKGVRDACATGVWVDTAEPRESTQSECSPEVSGAPMQHCEGRTPHLKKLCAMGVKLRRWISLHGLALNITTDLTYFDLINPCGLSRPVTSMRALLGERCPAMADVKREIITQFARNLRGDVSSLLVP